MIVFTLCLWAHPTMLRIADLPFSNSAELGLHEAATLKVSVGSGVFFSFVLMLPWLDEQNAALLVLVIASHMPTCLACICLYLPLCLVFPLVAWPHVYIHVRPVSTTDPIQKTQLPTRSSSPANQEIAMPSMTQSGPARLPCLQTPLRCLWRAACVAVRAARTGGPLDGAFLFFLFGLSWVKKKPPACPSYHTSHVPTCLACTCLSLCLGFSRDWP